MRILVLCYWWSFYCALESARSQFDVAVAHPTWIPGCQLSDAHSSSATRSLFGSGASSVSTTTGCGERPPAWSGIMNCGWTASCCAPPLPVPLLEAAAVVRDSECSAGFPRGEPSDFNCKLCAADDAAGTDGAIASMFSVSTGITTCLHTHNTIASTDWRAQFNYAPLYTVKVISELAFITWTIVGSTGK